MAPSLTKPVENPFTYLDEDLQSCTLTDQQSQLIIGESPLMITEESQDLSKESRVSLSLSFEHLNAEQLSLESYLNGFMRKRNFGNLNYKGKYEVF